MAGETPVPLLYEAVLSSACYDYPEKFHMKKSELLQILNNLGIHPGRRFGQNFMIDNNLLDFIYRTASPQRSDLIMEIGPGLGALTRKLLDSGAKVIAVELDKRLADYLQNNLRHPELQIIQGDACRIDILRLVKENCGSPSSSQIKWRCIANLPYSITSPFIAKMIELPCPPSDMLFMLQMETGQRLAASPKNKSYGSLTVLVQSVYHVELLRTVQPQVFFPQPEVESAILRFTRKSAFPNVDEIKILSKVVRTAFSQRRKMMIKALSDNFGKEKTAKAFEQLEISANSRAEDLDVGKFLFLSQELSELPFGKPSGSSLR